MTLRRFRVLSIIFLIILLLAAAAWLRRDAILDYSAHFLVRSDPLRHADLVLVLGGDFYGPRVIKAAELGASGYAPLVMISGPPYQGRPEGEFAVAFLTARGFPRSLFYVLGHDAHSTTEEAIAVCPELTRRGVKRVMLVTSSYHSRRAHLVFSLFCPGIEYSSAPAEDPHYDPDRWRMDAGSNALFQSEWKKIFGTVLWAYPREKWSAFTRRLGRADWRR